MTRNPLSPARDEENRRLAEFVGFTEVQVCFCIAKPITARWSDGKIRHVDFYTDEAANALLLEKMPDLVLRHRSFEPREWLCYPTEQDRALAMHCIGNPISGVSADRKTAVVKCALACLEAQK